MGQLFFILYKYSRKYNKLISQVAFEIYMSANAAGLNLFVALLLGPELYALCCTMALRYVG